MENQTEESTLTLKEIFYIIKRHIFLEAAIVFIGIIIGIAISLMNKDIWVACCNVSVKANLNQNISYNDTSLSKMVMPTIKDLMSSNGVIIERAKEIADTKDISVNSISVQNNEDSLIMTVYYSDDNPQSAVIKLKAIIKAAQEVVKEPGDNSYSTDAQTAKDNLRDTINEISGELDSLDKNSEEYKNLEQLLNDAKSAYKYIQIGNQMSKYFFAIIELEPTQSEPSVMQKDNDIRTIILATLISAVFAVALSVLIYLISDKVISEDAVEKITGKKNLICIPGKRSKQTKYGEMRPLELTQLSDALIFMKNMKKSVAYQVQSTTSGEGKSTIVANLGKSLAAAGRKTLIIDCDFKKRKIRSFFNLENVADIVGYFKDEKEFKDVINPSGYDGLDIVTVNSTIENHTVIFTSEKFVELIKKAKELYEFILLDCGPVGLISDYINISKHVDGTLLVVSCNQVKSVVLKNTVKALENCNARIIGTVFNFCNTRDHYKDYYYQNE